MTDIKNEEAGEKKSLNFIEQAVENDLKAGKNGGKVQTRFPPEPNGYLHIGHAKAICLDFGIAAAHGGVCNLRFDDTNPTKEDMEYVEAIQEDIRWLGFQWGNVYYASDYFQQLWDFAMSILARSTMEPSLASSLFIFSNRARLSSIGRLRYGLSTPGWVGVPFCCAICSEVCSST